MDHTRTEFNKIFNEEINNVNTTKQSAPFKTYYMLPSINEFSQSRVNHAPASRKRDRLMPSAINKSMKHTKNKSNHISGNVDGDDVIIIDTYNMIHSSYTATSINKTRIKDKFIPLNKSKQNNIKAANSNNLLINVPSIQSAVLPNTSIAPLVEPTHTIRHSDDTMTPSSNATTTLQSNKTSISKNIKTNRFSAGRSSYPTNNIPTELLWKQHQREMQSTREIESYTRQHKPNPPIDFTGRTTPKPLQHTPLRQSATFKAAQSMVTGATMKYEDRCIQQLKYCCADLSDSTVIDNIKQFCVMVNYCTDIIISCLYIDGSTNYRTPNQAQRKRYKQLNRYDKLMDDVSAGKLYAVATPIVLVFKFILKQEYNQSHGNQQLYYMLPVIDYNTQSTLHNQLYRCIYHLMTLSTINKIVYDVKQILCTYLLIFNEPIPYTPLPNTYCLKHAIYMLDTDDINHTKLQFDVVLGQHNKIIGKRLNENNECGTADESCTELLNDINHTYQSWCKYQQKLQYCNMWNVYVTQEIPLIYILCLMQCEGLTFDRQSLIHLNSRINELQHALKSDMYRLANTSFDIYSSKQVSQLFYHKLNYRVPAVHVSGRSAPKQVEHPTVNDQALIHIINMNINQIDSHGNDRTLLPKKLRIYRKLSKLQNTYITPYAELATVVSLQCASTELRIYSQWLPSRTGTGRLAAQNPNIQSLPKRAIKQLLLMTNDSIDDAGNSNTVDTIDAINDSDQLMSTDLGDIRSAFTAHQSNYILLAADYNQVEMRWMAVLSNDIALCDLLQSSSNSDIYKQMATMCYNIPITHVTDYQREICKSVSLGIIYGMGAKHMADKLSTPSQPMTPSKAQAHINAWHRAFPDVKKFMNKCNDSARSRKNDVCTTYIYIYIYIYNTLLTCACIITVYQGFYIRTVTGRRRNLYDIANDSDPPNRALAERRATNTVMQGSASDMIKQSMIRIISGINSIHRNNGIYKQKLIQLNLQHDMNDISRDSNGRCITYQHPLVRIVGQLHDEIILEVMNVPDIMNMTYTVLRYAMEHVVADSKVQFPVNIKQGNNLGNMIDVTNNNSMRNQYELIDHTTKKAMDQHTIRLKSYQP